MGAIYAIFNAGEAVTVTLPEAEKGRQWQRGFDTGDTGPKTPTHVAADSVVAFVLRSVAD
jgi:hypothetical protein